MPEFSTEAEIDIDPSEFIDACSRREKDRLVEILIEDGFIEPDQAYKNSSKGVNRPNINDLRFWDSLDVLGKTRHLLSIEEEELIHKLAEKFKYLV